jgi:signal transduction histidine kinase
MYSLGLKIFAVLFLFIGAILFTTYKLNLTIQKEMTKIVSFLKSLTKKNKLTYITSDFSEEFDQITKLLTKVAQIIVKKEQVSSRHTQHLEESNRQKDDIISAISHEFKNPIAVVNGYSQTLLDDENMNPKIRKKFLKKIYKNGTKLSDLIDTLRLSMKLDGKQQKLSTKEVSLYKLTKECAQNLQINYPKKEVIIQGQKDITLHVDATLFGIVITNLIENGFKYSEDEVYVTITRNTLEVIDTGIGIKQEDLEKITQKFFRAQTNSWDNSLGLGLFLVNKILHLHNMKLEIISKENEGSTFRIVF